LRLCAREWAALARHSLWTAKVDTLRQDLRYGLRSLRKSPGFTAVAVLALSLGIGANTVLFSVISFALLRPVPFPDPQSVVVLNETAPNFPRSSCSWLDFLDWRAQAGDLFSRFAASRRESFNLTSSGEPERVLGRMATADLLPLTGVQPILGRLYGPDDDKPGAPRTVVLSYGLWQRRFGGDPGVIGKGIQLSGDSYSVIGVLPQDFRFLAGGDVFVPLGLFADRYQDRGIHPGIYAFGRLKPGVTLERVQASLDQVSLRLGEAHPEVKGNGVRVRLLSEDQIEDARPALLLLWGAVAFVLLIAAANVANLMLSRAASRQGEIAIRVALGASRLRIVRQLLTESVLLSLAGGALGLAFAAWGVDALSPHLAQLPRGQDIHLDTLALLFTVSVALFTGIGFGLLPALRASDPSVHLVLKEVRSPGLHGRLRSGLVVAEVALSMILLVGAGLFLRSFAQVTGVNPGFDPRGLLVFSVSLPPSRYATGESITRFTDELRRRAAQVPGVSSAAISVGLPIIDTSETSFSFEGRAPADPRQRPEADLYSVTPEYLQTMRIPLLQGRFFEEADGKRNVAVIDDWMARRHFPGESAIGHRFEGSPDGMIPPIEIVGVVGHVESYGLDGKGPVDIAWYVPQATAARIVPQFSTNVFVVARTAGDPLALAAPLRKLVEDIDPLQPIFAVQTMEQAVNDSIGSRRLTLLLLDIFAGLALLLASVGIYGVMSYSVTQRTREIGIRMALGAARSVVLRSVVGQGARLALIGITTGAGLALALSRLLQGLLFHTSATDPATYLLLAGLLGLLTVAASWLPALRASRVDPAVALRAE
jgi:putative ABC transport system permease protein